MLHCHNVSRSDIHVLYLPTWYVSCIPRDIAIIAADPFGSFSEKTQTQTIQNGRFIQGSNNQITLIKLKSMSSCTSDHKDFKNVWFAICPMFGNGVWAKM